MAPEGSSKMFCTPEKLIACVNAILGSQDVRAKEQRVLSDEVRFW